MKDSKERPKSFQGLYLEGLISEKRNFKTRASS